MATTSTPRSLLILGSGTAGSITANKLRKKLDPAQWTITVVAKDDIHDYKPGFLFIPFGEPSPRPEGVRKSASAQLRDGIAIVRGEIADVDPEADEVHLQGGTSLPYDQLVIATGAHLRPDQTEGMLGDEWHKSVGEFYSLEGAVALRQRLKDWAGGRLVMHITEMPIMCPVAPLEFVLLADAHLRARGLRDVTEIVYVTPLDGAFTKPVASRILGSVLTEHGITVEPDFMIESVDQTARTINSYDGREIPYDQLVTVPLNMGADYVGTAGLGDELNFVTVDKHTNRHVAYPNIWALGDAANLPTSKAGAVAHFSIDVFVENFLQVARGEEPTHSFDGHANCFVESGNGKALLLDFNYETEPLPGESRLNHLGKLSFQEIYWRALIPGLPIPLPADMSMIGKDASQLTVPDSAPLAGPPIPTF